MKLVQSFKQFLHDEEGAVAIEYALLAALIAVVIIASVTNIGTAIVGVFESIATTLGWKAPAP
jgi:pilus assembly protein Flp/PilA